MNRLPFIVFVRLCWSLCLCLCLFVGVALPNAYADQAANTWIVLGEGGQAVVRTVTAASACPILKQDGKLERMRVRAPAETIAQRKTASEPSESKPSAFPVLTCEAILRSGVKSAAVNGKAIALPKAQPRRIVVLGDTGCRMKKADDAFQACNEVDAWSFAAVAKKAASFKPDLVIHVGDYHYRENPCPESVEGCRNSPWGYGFDVWQADFFEPARPLLEAAPWVMTRGNHESCARAGQGYWRFLDPRPYLKGRDCNEEKYDGIGDYSAPYAIPLGKSADQSAQLIVFDSAKVPNKKMAKEDPARLLFSHYLKQVEQLASAADFNIMINHHPILGFSVGHKDDGSTDFKSGNTVLQGVMEELWLQRLFPDRIKMSLAGHVHLFQAVSFHTDHPMQFVSGNGGTASDKSLPTSVPAEVSPFAAAQVDQFATSNRNGFLVLEREATHWRVRAYDIEGRLISDCRSQLTKASCQ